MNVWLSRDFAPAEWGDGALLSYRADGVVIHLVTANPLLDIQQGARRLCQQGIQKVALAGHWDREQQWAFAQGLQTPKVEVQLQWAMSSEEDREELEARWLCGRWVREMTNATPEQLGPLELAVEAAAFITELAPDRVSHRILKGEALQQAGWVGLYQVGRGSEREPVLLELDFNPARDPRAPVAAALVGKGITFDSGGYSMKSSEGMLTMKCDMGGAAIVTGALALAMLRGLDKRVKLILCCAENLVSGHAYKLGDILTYKNGTTVEIVNTDAEGRLVLADGLQLASDSGAPLIIDAATLTGAAVMALGGRYNALFGLDKGLVSRAMTYADAEQEPAWPLPLEPWHRQQCPSHYADTANSRPVKGGGPGGASNAAGFLSRFVANEGMGWLHIDLAACFSDNGDALWAPGANTLGMRTIARALLAEAK
ncbi:aminopeptidase PepB [Aeromonas sobria]|jgi:PepB aminopeptidase|uniref:aminopeptidase PepB n=1 Tax=Aeromonas sobria TaxID=646 RepID=UPI00111B840A|nr:aminopeptidase PepB [Aeromonas sobria]ELM3616762.1 aminopeptidase PepB [Aeromonas sobria]TNJ20114.1 aminopeptidase PepB [Aeromonas sobria]HEH9425865.1 aminopeptidase PepB [Aeromonas sobria]HEH9438241.1 aminopeptidase PepB [Aeromonas sobria]